VLVLGKPATEPEEVEQCLVRLGGHGPKCSSSEVAFVVTSDIAFKVELLRERRPVVVSQRRRLRLRSS
jgi:hypothetical protein